MSSLFKVCAPSRREADRDRYVLQGYPGIPPGFGRPPAEVMGSIEVRFGKDALKTKWVRIAMVKIETLPGGGPAAVSTDFIGTTPQDLLPLNAGQDYDMIIAREFPFRIRLPETIPPSMAFEKDAGIKYELVASVCVKGKRGLLRKDSSTVIEDRQLLQIDKHELHSTWPIYNQPDSRSILQEQLRLTVTRSQSCFSPGERVHVTATLQSSSFNASQLRAFEMALVQTIHLRLGPKFKASKKMGPQVRKTLLGEQKVPVNTTLFGGMHHVAELTCPIPNDHIIPTVNSARHVDISISLVITAHVENLRPIIVELPVTLSNWQKNMSSDLVNRIGYAPNLSVGSPPDGLSPQKRVLDQQVLQTSPSANQALQTIGSRDRFSTVDGVRQDIKSPVRPASSIEPDEFGQRPASTAYQSVSTPIRRSIYTEVSQQGSPKHAALDGIPEKSAIVTRGLTPPDSVSRQSPPTNTGRFAVQNVVISEGSDADHSPPPSNRSHPHRTSFATADEEKRRTREHYLQKQASAEAAQNTANDTNATAKATTNGDTVPAQRWPSADDEKRKLYEEAQKKVVRTQSANVSPPIASATASSSKPALRTSQTESWPSAEDEKRRLFNQAQESARRNQQLVDQGNEIRRGHSLNQESRHVTQYNSSQHLGETSSETAARSHAASNGALLYSNAMSSLQSSAPPSAVVKQTSSNIHHSPPNSSTNNRHSPPATSRDGYQTAEQEKAALRYREAKEAVLRSVGVGSQIDGPSAEGRSSSHDPPPIAYEELYPEKRTSALETYIPAVNSPSKQPDMSSNIPLSLNTQTLPDTSDSKQSDAGPSGLSQHTRKEPRKASLPTPPPSGGRQMPLSAAEEKALLKARYDAEKAAFSINEEFPMLTQNDELATSKAAGLGRDPSVSAGKQRAEGVLPPPLMPRPPAHYIEETQAEDERMKEAVDGMSPHWNSHSEHEGGFALQIRPFSPFSVGLPGIEAMASPPPLPPKVPLS